MSSHNSASLPPLVALGPDLIAIHPLQRFWVLARPFLFFVAYFWLTIFVHPAFGLPLLIAMFIANMAAAHDVVHNSLRLSSRATDFFLAAYGVMVFQSGHSFRVCHLHHHAVFPSQNDPEAAAAFVPLWRALLMGPSFVPKLLYWSLGRMRRHPRELLWIVGEASMSNLAILVAIALIPISAAPLFYMVIVILGTWLNPFVTAYFPHHHVGADAVHHAKTIHGRIIPWLLLGLGYHLEHHLYPRVPGHHLHKLADRLQPILEAQGADVMRVL
jgi:beta-carotene hydroxylase